MSKREPYGNQLKESTAAASAAMKIVSTMSKETIFRRGGDNNQNSVRELIIQAYEGGVSPLRHQYSMHHGEL